MIPRATTGNVIVVQFCGGCVFARWLRMTAEESAEWREQWFCSTCARKGKKS